MDGIREVCYRQFPLERTEPKINADKDVKNAMDEVCCKTRGKQLQLCYFFIEHFFCYFIRFSVQVFSFFLRMICSNYLLWSSTYIVIILHEIIPCVLSAETYASVRGYLYTHPRKPMNIFCGPSRKSIDKLFRVPYPSHLLYVWDSIAPHLSF